MSREPSARAPQKKKLAPRNESRKRKLCGFQCRPERAKNRRRSECLAPLSAIRFRASGRRLGERLADPEPAQRPAVALARDDDETSLRDRDDPFGARSFVGAGEPPRDAGRRASIEGAGDIDEEHAPRRLAGRGPLEPDGGDDSIADLEDAHAFRIEPRKVRILLLLTSLRRSERRIEREDRARRDGPHLPWPTAQIEDRDPLELSSAGVRLVRGDRHGAVGGDRDAVRLDALLGAATTLKIVREENDLSERRIAEPARILATTRGVPHGPQIDDCDGALLLKRHERV